MTSNEPIQADPPSVPESSAAPPAAGVPCCPQADAKSQKACPLCGKPTCKACRTLVNSQYLCRGCRDQILQELEAERAGAIRLPPAILAGLAGAVIGGGIWALIVILTNFAIGYVAVGVGWLAGMAVVIGAGRKKGQVLQIVAVLCAALGLVIGKYFIVVHAIKGFVAKDDGQEAADAISYFGGKTVEVFFELLPQVVRPFDALWLILALGIAWRIPKPTAVRIGLARRGV
jgi:hypothetical protein